MEEKTMTSFNVEEFRQQLDYIKSAVDPRYLLELLGFKIERDSGKEIRAACKIHNGDNTTAFRFNKETKTWVCFTHKCHELYGYDIIGLIRACNNLGFIDAVKYLKKIVGNLDGFSSKLAKYNRDRSDNRFIEEFGDNEVPRIVNEDSLLQFKHFRSDRFIKDGFKKETLDHFEIAGGYTDSFGYVRDIIPIRDVYGDLVAYSMRDIRDEVGYDFKYLLTKGFDKDKVIYNLCNVKDLCNNLPLIVVEGFKSVWRFYEYGIHNAVCVMGSLVTKGQIDLLNVYANKGVVIMFDNDEAGVNGCIKSVERLKKELMGVPVVPIFITETDENGNGLDPSDLSKECVYSYLNNYIGDINDG